MWEFLTRIKDGVFNELVAHLSAAIPKITITLVVLFIGWMIAKGVRNVVQRVLATIGVDRLAAQLNEIDLVQRTGTTIKISAIFASMIYYIFMMAFLILATDMLGIQAITDMVRDLINYLPALFSAFVLLLLGLFLAEMIRKALQTTLQSLGLSSAKTIANAVFYFLFVTIAVSALSQAKINTGFIASNLTVIIGAGALAFAIGYGIASRDLIASYLAGYYNRNKVRIGDDIEIIGVRGKVVMIDSTSIILQTPERAIVIPLAKLTTEKVEIIYPDPHDGSMLNAGAPADSTTASFHKTS